MEPTSRESLRRAVRRAVHDACWQRLEGDHATAHADPGEEIARAREEHEGVNVSDTEISDWIIEDEAEFDRAMLISDLVARQVHRTAASPTPAIAAAAATRPELASSLPRRPSKDESTARPPVRTAPTIAALLDDMLAQRRAAPGEA